jgi:hypothetical protein
MNLSLQALCYILFCLAVATFSISALANGFGPITMENWLEHPEIRQIRSIYTSVQEMRGSGRLIQSTRQFEYCEPSYTYRAIYRSSKGVIRLYELQGGSDDSTVSLEHYYDEEGALRFVLVSYNAVNGTNVEERFYFSQSMEKIWEDRRELAGPGWAWDTPSLVKSADDHFYSDAPCPEIDTKSEN